MIFPFRTDKDLTDAGWLTPTEAACAQAFNDLVRKERDYERVLSQRLERELAAALAENNALRDKALRFDLDQAGIEARERDAVELVRLRADTAALRRDAEAFRAIEAHSWHVERDIEGDWVVRAPRRYGRSILIAEGIRLRSAIEAAIAREKEAQR